MSPPPINAVVGEDHPLMLQAITAMLDAFPGVHIAKQVETIPELERFLQQFTPDLMVVDIYIRQQCVFDLLRDYLKVHASVRVLVVSAHDADLFAHFSRKIGARGFISKSRPLGEIKDALMRVIHGEEAWPDAQQEGVTYNVGEKNRLVQDLTLREMDVFLRIGRWKSIEEIAEELAISPKTVELHRMHIKEKLKFASSRELLHCAVDWQEMEGSGPG